MHRPPPLILKKLVLMGALQLTMIWDLITTLLGIILILESVNPVALSQAVIGCLIVVAFSFSTRSLWQQRQGYRITGPPLILLRLVWGMAIFVDLWTSLTCNTWFIGAHSPEDSRAMVDLLSHLNLGQLIIVMFVTLVTGVSPILVGYLRNQDIDAWLS
ncbi:MAG: hypothetical protein ACOYMP_07910 [Nodosilinea sp.]